MTRLLLSLILLAGSIATVRADTNAEAEIHALIRAVAEHPELKYSRGKRYADSAEAFIDLLARRSSWSGEPYQLICDGEKQPAGDWLTMRPEALRSQ